MHRNTPCLHQLALSQPPLSKQITALEEHIVLTVDQIVALAVFGPQCTWTCNVHTTLKKTLHKTQNTKEARANRGTGWKRGDRSSATSATYDFQPDRISTNFNQPNQT